LLVEGNKLWMQEGIGGKTRASVLTADQGGERWSDCDSSFLIRARPMTYTAKHLLDCPRLDFVVGRKSGAGKSILSRKKITRA
jgi:hypothetical protein